MSETTDLVATGAQDAAGPDEVTAALDGRSWPPPRQRAVRHAAPRAAAPGRRAGHLRHRPDAQGRPRRRHLGSPGERCRRRERRARRSRPCLRSSLPRTAHPPARPSRTAPATERRCGPAARPAGRAGAPAPGGRGRGPAKPGSCRSRRCRPTHPPRARPAPTVNGRCEPAAAPQRARRPSRTRSPLPTHQNSDRRTVTVRAATVRSRDRGNQGGDRQNTDRQPNDRDADRTGQPRGR